MLDTAARGREIIFKGRTLRDTLNALSRLAEAEMPGAVAGYTLVDEAYSVIKESVFPSLPPVFQESISLIPLREPFTGACAQAIYEGTPVISNDILSDMRFDMKWRELC